MIFLTATEPNVKLNIYGASFYLNPIRYPEVDTTQIIVMEDPLGKQILESNNDHNIQRISFETSKIDNFPIPLASPHEISPLSKVLILRGGGIGDVLMCTPAIRELRKRLPEGVQLILSTFKNNMPLFVGNPDIDAVIPEPLTLADLLQFDYYLEFKDPDDLISRIHLTDFYLTGMGIDPSKVSEKEPVLAAESLFNPSVANLVKQIGRNHQLKIYLNGIASDKLRDLPPETLELFIRKIPDAFFFLPVQYVRRYPDKTACLELPNCFLLNTQESLSDYITAISSCEIIITTDSSAYHIAAALNKPCITLFGPIDPSLRTTYYPSVQSFKATYQGVTCNAPCGKSMYSEFYGGRTSGQAKCPEAIQKTMEFSPCLYSISFRKLVDSLAKDIGQPPSNQAFDPSHDNLQPILNENLSDHLKS